MNLAVALSFFVGLGVAKDTPASKEKAGNAVSKLPAHVLAAPGRLTLFADFKKRDPRGIPLYVVNRTGKPIDLFTYNGQPLLALEYEAQPGKWKPARAVDAPLCGNSLKPLKLANETYLLAHGYQPTAGFRAKVRYRFVGEVKPVSNPGVGVVSHDDLTYLLVSTTSDFRLLSKVASGEFILPTESADFRPLAIRRLAEPYFDRSKAETVLKSIAAGSDKQSAKVARDTLEFIRKFRSK
jgi:hypothetical protein